jgi:hypothetical protein
MANRYWVGGTAAWDGTAGTKWALTSGGAGGQAIPTSADDVFFDITSGANTITISTGNTGAKSINCTGFVGTLTGTAAITVAGSVTLVGTMTYSYTGTLTITSTSTITSAGKTFGPITISSSSLTVSLGDTLTLSAASTFTLTQGVLALAGFNLNCGIFSSSATVARSISFGSNNIALTSVTAFATVLSMANATSFTWTGTGGFTRNNGFDAIVVFGTTGGTRTNAPNLTVNAGTAPLTITTNSLFKDVNFTGSTCTVTGTYTACGNLTLATGGTYTGVVPTFLASGTVTSNGKTLGNVTVASAGITVTLADAMTLPTTGTFTLTLGTIDLAGFTLSTGLFASSNSNTRSIAFGSTGKIQLTSATTSTIWSSGTVTGFSYTGTSSVEVIGAGSGVTKTINTGTMSESQALNWAISDTGGVTTNNTVTFSASSAVRNLTVNSVGKYQISNSALTIYGNYSYSPGYTFTPGQTSVFFNGTTDAIRNLSTASTALDLSTGDFTIEAWIYKTTSQQGNILSLVNVSSGSNAGLSLQTSATNTFTQNDGVTATVNSGTFSLNTWTHVAAVRTAGNTQLYLNGVASGATFTQAPRASQYFQIGCTVTTTLIFFPGYISNLRVVKGVAVYSGTFTPPSLAPLAISGAASAAAYPSTANVNTSFASSATSILACQSAMDILVDNSVYKFPITVAGTPAANGLNPYGAPVLPLIGSGNSVWTFASTGTQTITTGGVTHDMPITVNGVGGTATLQDALTIGVSRLTTLTNGTLNLNNLTLSTGFFSSSNSNTRVLAFGSTGKIQLTQNTTATSWTTSTTTGFSYTGTSNIESFAGGAVTKTITCGALTEAQSLSFTFLDVAGTISISSGSAFKNLTLNGAFLLNNNAITIYGNYLYTAATGVNSGANAWTFATTGSQSINTGGLTHSFPFTFNGAGGTFNLAGSITIGASSVMTLTNGTLDLNGYTFTAGIFTTGVGTKNITFDGGTLAVGFVGATAFNNANPAGFTTTAGTGTGTIRMTGGSAKTFVGGGSTYNCTLDQGGAGALTITGSNTFNDISNSRKSTSAATITFTSGTTTTVNNFSASGEAGRVLTLNTDLGTTATLSKPTGTVSVSYCSISNSAATGGATWEALLTNGNINNGGNSGWTFVYATNTGNMFLMFS